MSKRNHARRRSLGRREFLGGAAAAAAAGLALTARGPAAAAAAEAEPLAVEGYGDRMSCAPGERIAFHVSTNAERYSLEIARVGAERKVVWEKNDLPGAKHPMPADAATHGCHWPAAVSLEIPKDWSSGYYSVMMRGTRGGEASPPQEMFFIVRPPAEAGAGSGAKILLQLSSNTYQAYNNWGGSCLYSGPKFPRVSFDRPFAIYETPRTPGADWYNPNTNCCHTWDLPFLAWAERAGYAVDCCANLDLERHPELLKRYRVVLSVGHDEYWSGGMRDALEKFIAAGGNAAFLSGNSVCWQVRTEDAGRALVCYKMAYDQDPVFNPAADADNRTLTALWSNPLLKRPENHLSGVGFPYGGYNTFFGEFMEGPGSETYAVHRPDHWLLAGTGLKAGDRFGEKGGIAGYECDGCEFVTENGLPVPTGRDGTPKDFQIVATAPARWSPRDGSLDWAKGLRAGLRGEPAPADTINRDGSAVLGTYTRGGTVVTAGSTDWAYGLAAGDAVTDRIVRNILDRLSK
jgi:hypothetical protein